MDHTQRLAHLLAYLDTRQPGATTGSFKGLKLSSHFQPIYSLSHARVVGHEALLRARDTEERPVSPLDVFQSCRTTEELTLCDSLSHLIHLSNFSAVLPESQWLFLNVQPDMFQLLCKHGDSSGDRYIRNVMSNLNLSGDTIVLEVLESNIADLSAFQAAMALVRSHGCLIAIDDFGAGYSNFDRVWRLQPDIVKLDRSLIVRAARERRAHRVVSQMVSLLHECGAMVLMEGVETLDEALLAMESDADMVQGYFFGRPQAALIPAGQLPESIMQLYAGLGERRQQQRLAHRNWIAPYRNAIGNAGVLLSAGRPPAQATKSFLELDSAELCYVLDAEGYQIGHNVWRQGDLVGPSYRPLQETEGACWARRPYFRRAIENVGKVQVTRPHRSLQGNHTCVTASYAYFHAEGDRRVLRVVCGDLTWHEGSAEIEDTRF